MRYLTLRLRHCYLQAFKIEWKDNSKNLTKLYPRVMDDHDDDLPRDGGSIFNYFEHPQDPFDVSFLPCSL